MALAAQLGRVPIVRLLLNAGEDLNRYNQRWRALPLHTASPGERSEAIWNWVSLLIEGGAQIDILDVLGKETPAGWAHPEGKTEVEAYLRRFKESAESHR